PGRDVLAGRLRGGGRGAACESDEHTHAERKSTRERQRAPYSPGRPVRRNERITGRHTHDFNSRRVALPWPTTNQRPAESSRSVSHVSTAVWTSSQGRVTFPNRIRSPPFWGGRPGPAAAPRK